MANTTLKIELVSHRKRQKRDGIRKCEEKEESREIETERGEGGDEKMRERGEKKRGNRQQKEDGQIENGREERAETGGQIEKGR